MSEVFDLSTPWRRAALARALFALAPSQSGLALRAGAGPVRDAFLGNGVGKRLRDVLLADDVGKTLRAVFSGDDLIGHF